MTGAVTASTRQLTGMRAFTLVWVGQLVSLLGSNMSRFALTIWAWEITGEATALALVGFFAFAPSIIMTPIAGVLVDRWDRKLMMMVSDLAAGLATVMVFLLYNSGQLQIWHLYLAGIISGSFQAFQFPAFSAATTLMLDKSQYARASAMSQLAESIAEIAAPSFAALLLVAIGLRGVLLIDMITFVFAVGVILPIFIPQPPLNEKHQETRESFWRELSFGFRYIYARKPLLGVQMVFFGCNLAGTIALILLSPMILARTNSDETILGIVQTALGAGGLIGGIAVTIWGVPSRRVFGVLLGMVCGGLFLQVGVGLGQNVLLWALCGFLGFSFFPLTNAANQTLWQSKVSPDIQGKVFAVRRLVAQFSTPISMLLAGPLADRLFEPAMQPDGVLAPIFGGLVGVGAGSGMAVLFILSGIVGIGVAVAGFVIPTIREVDLRIPDHTRPETV